MTPEELGSDYLNSLGSLTFNSRPIIQSHTTIAQENPDAASEIVKAIEKRIQRAIPPQKLYAFYLMDSISKNIGVPYTTLFSSNLAKMFTQTYSLVDDPTRQKLIDLFKTWKLPNPVTGMSLFAEDQLEVIEKFLIKATANNRPPSMDRKTNSPAPSQKSSMAKGQITPEGLIIEIDELTNLVNSRLLQMPNDTRARERFDLLQKLRQIMSSGAANVNEASILEAAKKQLVTIREDEIMKLNAFKLEQQQISSTS
ncbi:unnamed protein product [Ambrosiozyma monospora]|uniref:Unnamed protein product n=1 Tax=Ambrosiozyma monospora TaxID=43982 RepID=A0ACB5SS12_AMBMO|nr:unnamed protein product [Ambrosiozyma monospora]